MAFHYLGEELSTIPLKAENILAVLVSRGDACTELTTILANFEWLNDLGLRTVRIGETWPGLE